MRDAPWESSSSRSTRRGASQHLAIDCSSRLPGEVAPMVASRTPPGCRSYSKAASRARKNGRR